MVFTFLVGVPARKRSRNQSRMIARQRASLESSEYSGQSCSCRRRYSAATPGLSFMRKATALTGKVLVFGVLLAEHHYRSCRNVQEHTAGTRLRPGKRYGSYCIDEHLYRPRTRQLVEACLQPKHRGVAVAAGL